MGMVECENRECEKNRRGEENDRGRDVEGILPGNEYRR